MAATTGQIHMSYREAASLCKCSQKPIRRAFDELQEIGFIKVAKKGAFSVKVRHATEWILTEHPVGNELATKEFMRWKKPNSNTLTKKSRRTHGTGSAYPKLKLVNKTDEKHADGVPREYRKGGIEGNHGVLRGYTNSLPCTHSTKLASGPLTGQAQPSDVQGNMVASKKNNPQADVIRAAGGFCKIIDIKKNGFDEIVKQHTSSELDEGQLRAAVIRTRVLNLATSQLAQEQSEATFHG